MNKCEWKDGKFEGCEAMQERINCNGWIMERVPRYNTETITVKCSIFLFCPFCGVDIRKPEEKPLIVKSGGTYAAYSKGVDYLCTNPNPDYNLKDMVEDFNYLVKELGFSGTGTPWKSFTGDNPDITELTDELALLRPMVILNCETTYQLVHVQDEGLKHIYANSEDRYYTINKCRLATAHELQEAE